MPVVHELLPVAKAAVDAADQVSLGYFGRRGLCESRKADGSAVTVADVAAEEAIRATLERLAPGVPVHAEEATTAGGQPPASADCWVVDPIDGTENFLRGIPVWATLLALRTGSIAELAVVSAPALRRRWTAAAGQGAYAGEQRIAVSGRTAIASATMAYGGLHELPSAESRTALLAAASQFKCAWGWGNFWGHALVAEGAIDAALSHGTELWDTIAPALLVSEAGGSWSDVGGRPLLDNGSLLTSNGRLHDRLVRDLRESAGVGGGVA